MIIAESLTAGWISHIARSRKTDPGLVEKKAEGAAYSPLCSASLRTPGPVAGAAWRWWR